VKQDIDFVLDDWEYKPGAVQARLVTSRAGREVIQMRGKTLVLNEEQCQDADREFIQFYHRRICWLALRQYGRAMRDADHTLAFMDFIKDHSPSPEYTEAHEQYRGFVLFQRTQAASALKVEDNHPDLAIDAVRKGIDELRVYLGERGQEEQFEEDGMVKHLRRIETTLREQFQIGATLQEQLDEAVAREDYERAAQLRDALKKRQ
jgi:hypothetical protein